ncbi:interleukin-like EMT inducer domain-containing protein [Acinetobacter baumannii]|uniref:interleukin-like EMT inducer domain-containing protein n=1 Tax=Acinetobacter baumannii TaxID=470 RepID=UPI003AF5906F
MTGTTKNALLSELRKKKLITGSSTSSKTKSVGAIPVVQDKTLQTWIKGITNQLQEIDKSFVRSKDLAKTGLVDVDGNGNISLPKPEDNSTIVPKAVEELKATGAYSTVTLDWKTPKSKFFGRNEVYRSEKNDFGTAVNIGSSTGDVYTDYVGNNSKAYYWVRTISKAGVQGALSSSVYAETSIDIDYLLENLSEQISEGLLSQSIKDQLAGIDKNAEYIKSVEAQVQDKIAEVKDIIGRDIIESKLSVSQHLNDAQIRMSEAEIRIEDYKKYSESIVDAAKKLALEADLDLQKYIKDVQQYANDQVALLSNSVNEVRKQAELAQQTADNEIIERKVQVDEAITKASNMIDAAKVEMGNQTNVLIDEKLVPIKTQNETAIRDIKNLGTQYINLDKKIDAGILNEATIRSDKDDALSHRMDVQFAEFTSELTKAKSTILSESETRANENQALTLQINNATSEIGKNKSSISEVRQTLSDFQTSTASKFDSIESGITTNNGKIQGQIAEVEKSVSSLEGTTNTKFSNLSSSLKETDDIAKTAINNAAKAQETATTAVNKADANSQKILTISAKTSGLNNAIQATATADFLNEWKITSGANELRLIDEPTARGGKVLRAGNNNGNDTIWAHWNAFIPFDENKTYAIKYRYRRVNGNGGVYVGLAVKDSTQASFVNIADKLDTTLGSSHYAEVNAMPALGDFVTGISYFKGRELAGVNVGYGKSPLQNPRKLPSKAAFISVMFIANYNAFAGEVDIDYIDLVDAEAAVIGFNAEAKATDLFKTASTATQTVADRSTLLETQMRDAQGKIESNSLALNKTATKSELDAAMGQVATNINAAINGLTLGGVNAVANSEAPRTSTAASNKEYLMYERSAELKAFYDENLNKQITISFEMSVPVVGPVQVYSSNASAHTFSVTVNVVIPNEWIKYIVTVIPKPHTSSTTVSTIEFYGTYGSGRIPTIRKLQIEAGNKATAWSPSPRDFNALIDAQAQAIKETNAEVKKQGDTISSQGVDLTKLKNDLITTNQEVSKRATTEALNITNSKVEDQQGKLKAVTEQATALSASLKRVAAAGANLLIQSNVVGTYNGSSYPHHRYKLGEDWEVGATYTLMWCAEHQRNNTDTSSSLSVYAGGGQQVLQSVVNTNGKVINKITFVKNSQGIEQRVLNFYMINRPSAAQGSIGTVYWAVLVKGDLITTESWIPSAYDYNVAVDQVNANFNDFKQTYVTDKEALTKRTSSLETGLSNAEKNIDNTAKALQNYATNAKLDEVTASQTNQLNAEIKKVKGSIDSASDSNSLLPDFNLKNPEDWINYYNYDLSQHFKKTTTGKVGNTVFRKDTSNQAGCWVNSRKALPTNRPYKVSFWVRRSADSTGTCNITAMYGKADGIFSNAAITAVYIDTNKIPADEQWVLIEQVVNFNLHPQVKLGFSIGHNATGGWWELQGFSVENVVTEKDVDSTLVRATQLQSYSTKVDTTKAVATATDAMESKFKQKFGNMWTDSTATLDSTRYTKSETDRAIADESKTLKAALSLSGGDNIIKNGDFSKPLDGTNWRQNAVVAGNTFEIFKDANGATYGRFTSSNTTTMFKGVVEQITLADGLEIDQTYTLSFKAKSLTAAQISLLLIIHRYDGSSNNQLQSSWQLYTDKETICTYTFKTNVANLRSINIILYAPTGIAPDFLIREVQIEKGELATGFRVNPRELKDSLNATAEKLEGTRADVKKQGDSITSLTENYNILKSNVDLNKQAVDGKFQEINTTISNNQQNITQSINSLDSSYKQLNQDLGQVINYRVYSSGWNNDFTGIKNLKGEIKSTASNRGFSVHVLAANGGIASSTRYDTYGDAANAVAMSNALQALPNNTYVIITNYDHIALNLKQLKDSLVAVGANPLTIDQFTGRDAYILVGQKGIGAGRGIELHATPDSGINGAKQIMLAVQVVDGVPIGLANNSGNLQKVIDNQAQMIQQKITRADAQEVFGQEIKTYSAKIDAIQYAEDNWILANDEPKSVSITTGTNRTVAVWDLMYRHKDLPINKGDPIVVRLKYTADSGLIGAACIPQFHGGTYTIGVNSFIVAASGEVELKGIFPSDLKATAFDFVPLGLRFDNAPAGGVFTVTNAFISRGNSAPNFKGGFKSVLKQNAQFVEDTFVRAEANKQVIAQQIQQYDASIPEGMATVVKSTKVTADNAAKDLASFKSVDFKQLQNSTNNLGTALESTTMLAMMITNGKLLYGDVNFKKGMNNVGTYNNLGNGTVSVTREAKSADNPTTSTHELRIVTTGSASPNFGGFHQQFFTRSNAIFIIKYLIKLPIGYKLYPAANLMGDGSVDKFIGSTDGTGRFEVYVRMVKSGATGRFDTSGFVHVAGGPAPTPESPLIWTLAQIECYDVTDYASADPNLQDFVSTANESLGTLTNFKETWASKLTEMSSKLDRTNSAYILNSDLTNTNIERAIAASSNQLKSEYIDPLQKNTESLKENILTNVDLSGLNPDIYYPVIFRLATVKQRYDFKVFCTLDGQNNSNVPWATHGSRTFGLNCEWSVTANGWGTQAESRIIEKFSYSWTPQSPLINIRQMSNASIEVVFLRGGARYDISHYKTITPLIKTEFFTALGQSIEPIQYNSSLVPVPIFAEIVKAQDVAGAAARSVADIQRDYITSSKLNEAFASTTERMSALYSANSQSIMTSAQTTFEKDWINRTPSGSRIGMRLIEDQTCRGGFAIRMGDNSGNDEVWLNWFATLPIDENKMYRIKYRYRRVSGAGVVYVGATCFNAAKTAFITDSNYINGDIGSSHYVVGGAAPALGTWVTGVAYFKGRSAGASSGAGTLTNPKTFANKAAFFTPVFIGNYSAQAGEVDLDFIDIEDADNLADLETFKTTYASDKTAYTSVIDTLTSTFGDKAIGLTEQKKFVDGVKGVATFLINNNGIATGWGTTSELVNGQVKTEFGVYSSRFFVASDTNAKTFPFIVDGNNVIMNTAIIKDGSIQSAKIGNLGADKITSGDIAADRMKANIVEAARGQFQSLSSITATIGHLRTSETGARIEIADQFIKSFDNNGVKRVQIGNLEL